jgi:hypothetical protein
LILGGDTSVAGGMAETLARQNSLNVDDALDQNSERAARLINYRKTNVDVGEHRLISSGAACSQCASPR